MQHKISTLDGAFDIIKFGQVAPHDAKSILSKKRSEFTLIDLAGASKDYNVKPVGTVLKLAEGSKTHGSGRTGYANSFFCHQNSDEKWKLISGKS